MTTIGKLRTGAVAYVSLLVGAGLSVAGNLADTYRTRGADIDNLDKIMAAAWPILVILAIEMFVSPRWSPKPMFQVWRWVGCLAVGGMAMVVSWTHLHDLMSARGQLVVVAVFGPLAIDGMAIMATGLILSTRVRGHVASRWEMTADTVKATATDGYRDLTADEVAAYREGLSVSADMATGAPTDMDTDTGRDRWADLVDGAMATTDSIMFDDPNAADMATIKAEADKLNGMATWATWTPADDRAVADMATPDIHLMSGLTREHPDTLPKRTRTAAGQSYPAEFADIVAAWDPATIKRADVVKQAAERFNVSTRTVRRWLAAVTGQPVSGPPQE